MLKKILENDSTKTGISFGITSGVITTLGLIVGLGFGTGSKEVVIGGIITIAVADAMSDALGIHVSEEAENNHTKKEVWTSTFSTFFTKLICALTFLFPVIFLNLQQATLASILWGGLLLGTFSYMIAKEQNEKPKHVIFEHLLVATLVIAITCVIGKIINLYFG